MERTNFITRLSRLFAIIYISFTVLNASAKGNPGEISEIHFFEGTLTQKNVTLVWHTTAHVKKSHFEVYRSYDGVQYELVAELKNTIYNEYEFTDQILLNRSKVYYKVKHVKKKDIFSTTPVLIFEDNQIPDVAVFPTICSDFVVVSGDQHIDKVKIIGEDGDHSKEVIVNGDKNIIDISHLPKGTYQMHIICNGRKAEKIITIE